MYGFFTGLKGLTSEVPWLRSFLYETPFPSQVQGFWFFGFLCKL